MTFTGHVERLPPNLYPQGSVFCNSRLLAPGGGPGRRIASSLSRSLVPLSWQLMHLTNPHSFPLRGSVWRTDTNVDADYIWHISNPHRLAKTTARPGTTLK
jgi:hypothetical protein